MVLTDLTNLNNPFKIDGVQWVAARKSPVKAEKEPEVNCLTIADEQQNRLWRNW
jgi:hypothetical protein